jgi:hypothetical protein
MSRAKPVPETVPVHIPFRLVKRGGRKEMQMPDGASSQRKIDNTLIKALARAFRWKRMLESGEFTTIAELAEHEGIAPSYMTRVMRLTLLAPATVDVILDGKSRCKCHGRPRIHLPQRIRSREKDGRTMETGPSDLFIAGHSKWARNRWRRGEYTRIG